MRAEEGKRETPSFLRECDSRLFVWPQNLDEEVERRQRVLKEGGVKTQQTPDQDPPAAPQVPETTSVMTFTLI